MHAGVTAFLAASCIRRNKNVEDVEPAGDLRDPPTGKNHQTDPE